jgi:hypothetical protein
MNPSCFIVQAHGVLVVFVIVRHFQWLEQTHQLTAESVRYESIMFYSTGPWCASSFCFCQILSMAGTNTPTYCGICIL